MEKTGELLKIGIPIMLGQACTVILSFADNIMIGWYGVNDLAASSFVNGLINFFIITELGFANGLTPLIGARFGLRDTDGIGKLLKNSIVLNATVAVAALALMAIIYLFLDKFGQDEALLPLIRPYYAVVAVSTLFAMGFNTLKQFTDGICQPVVSMVLLMGGNILNIIGNWVLIYGKAGFPEMGLLGAGISTLVSRIVMFAVFLLYIMKSARFIQYSIAFRTAAVSMSGIRKLFGMSYPLALQTGMETSTFTVTCRPPGDTHHIADMLSADDGTCVIRLDSCQQRIRTERLRRRKTICDKGIHAHIGCIRHVLRTDIPFPLRDCRSVYRLSGSFVHRALTAFRTVFLPVRRRTAAVLLQCIARNTGCQAHHADGFHQLLSRCHPGGISPGFQGRSGSSRDLDRIPDRAYHRRDILFHPVQNENPAISPLLPDHQASAQACR